MANFDEFSKNHYIFHDKKKLISKGSTIIDFSVLQKDFDNVVKMARNRRYGNENVAADGRDFEKEALEEALDCAVYLAARLIEIQDRRLINIINESNNGKSN